MSFCKVDVVLDPSEVYSHIVGRCFNKNKRELLCVEWSQMALHFSHILCILIACFWSLYRGYTYTRARWCLKLIYFL